MSKDVIYREDAIKAINARSDWYQVTCNGKQIAVMLMAKDVNEMLEKVPSAYQPQGEWIESFKRVEVKQGAYIGAKFVHDGWSCSECSEVVEKRYPNCPYCLARMKGVDDETAIS